MLGHERVGALLRRAVAAGRVPPALLFSGPEGIGKKALALAVARALVCERQQGEPCDACRACSRARRGLHPDLTLVEPATSVIKIEQVRDLVREVAALPFEAPSRAFVIDDAHVMTEEASNALLKSLEEPPPSSHVFLVTAAPQALLPTVRSRCQRLRLGPLPLALLEQHLQAVAGLTPEEARLRASLSGGSLGVALAFESDAFRSLRERMLALLEGLGAAERLQAAEELADEDDPALAMTALRSLLRDVLALRSGAAGAALLNEDLAPRLSPLARGQVGERAADLAELAERTRLALRGNANRLLALDQLVEALAP